MLFVLKQVVLLWKFIEKYVCMMCMMCDFLYNKEIIYHRIYPNGAPNIMSFNGGENLFIF